MRIVFCGTPEFAVPCLQHFLTLKDFEIAAVFTQPDRPQGRAKEIVSPPVKKIALAAGIPVHQPEKIRTPEAETILRTIAPEAIAIIAYGQIIPARLLDIPRLGWINLHASLLPKYRGAAPIQWAIANGEAKTGVTTMRIDAGMDTGEIVLQEELEIGARETTPELAARLAAAGAPLMARTLHGLADRFFKRKTGESRGSTPRRRFLGGNGRSRRGPGFTQSSERKIASCRARPSTERGRIWTPVRWYGTEKI